MFKSTDKGRTWDPMNQGLDVSAAFSLAIDPQNTAIVYAGTNRGVFRSDDGAVTWGAASIGLATDQFGNCYVYSLVASSRPTVIYAGTLLGIFKSQDGARTWQQEDASLRVGALPSVEALAVDPADSKVVYAGAAYQGLSPTVFKTEDGGDSWAPLTVGLSQGLVSSIAIDPQDHQRVFVATRGQGLFTTQDAGRTWRPVGQGVIESSISAVVAASGSSMVYAAGLRNAFYRSSDGGTTWEIAQGNVGNRGPTWLALEPASASNIWLASAGGLYFSSDGGSNWVESGQGIASSQIVSVVAHAADPNLMYVSAWAGGIYRTADGGSTWQAMPLGVGIAAGLEVDPADTSLVYAGMIYVSGIRDNGLYISRDAGLTWQLVPQLKGATVSAITTAPGKAYVGTDAGIYISEDSGGAWRQSNTGLSQVSQAQNLAIDPRDPRLLYLTMQSAPQTLYRSSDGGQSWVSLNTFPASVSALSPSPAAAGLLFAATSRSVFKSADGGASWQEMPLSDQGSAFALLAHPAAANTLYLGSSRGAYRSVDGGVHWTRLDLSPDAVASLAISPADPTRVYGGTLGKGLWSYTAVPSLTAAPESLTFLAEPGGGAPPSISLFIQDESGGSSAWTAQGPAWLTLSPSSGVGLPVTMTASLNTAGLSAGSYQDTLTITAAITGTRHSPLAAPASLRLGPLNRQYLPMIAEGSSAW
ncbi:MAG: hypothetical protein Q8R28_16640 [Dehalococcoidia bacterium]|nr:hypothetical protein [Dehalococcoidia bacterium]